MNISNLAGVSSDNENKIGASVRSFAGLENIVSKVALKYERPLHLKSSIFKQTVLLVTGEPDQKNGSFLER